MSRKREEKISTGYTVKAETESGVLKAYVSIFGIEDDSWFNDIIEPGAFKKTIAERGPGGSNKIRVLWMHRMGEVIGKVLRLEEHSRDMLPDYVRDRYPYASGGLYAETQLILGVQRGREAFELYKSEAMDEWSIGFDPIEERFEERDKRTVRILKEIRLWEYSPVTWGANPATTTVEVKNGILKLLDEIKAEHPEYNDHQLLQAAERRASQASDAPSNKPKENEERKTQVAVGADLKVNASFLLEETQRLFETVKAEHPEYGDHELIQAVEKRLAASSNEEKEISAIAPSPAAGAVIDAEPQAETQLQLNGSLLALLQELKAEHPDYDDLKLIQAVEERLSPKPDVIEPEPEVAKEAEIAVAATKGEPELPLVNAADAWKWVASRRVKIRELELALSKGHRHAEQH